MLRLARARMQARWNAHSSKTSYWSKLSYGVSWRARDLGRYDWYLCRFAPTTWVPRPSAPGAPTGSECRKVRSYPWPDRFNQTRSVISITQLSRRREVFPLLVLHLLAREPTYGNRLIESIGEITGGAISVNPNTMYPLLRDLEGRGLVDSRWEHPDRRTRRFYSVTPAGRREYKRLKAEVEPFLDSVISSVALIKDEIYGDSARS